MVREFTLPLSNCYGKFEEELYLYFEDGDEFETWLRNCYRVHVCGHKSIDYVDFALKNGAIVVEEYHRSGMLSWYTRVFPTEDCKSVDDLLDIIYRHTGHPKKYC